ncbi:MAG TPA: hypothetical protein VHP30_13665, partial [Ignavibacteriales bacterium]|nr:hypothetical protein [Ignavibacteriales bacterium]
MADNISEPEKDTKVSGKASQSQGGIQNPEFILYAWEINMPAHGKNNTRIAANANIKNFSFRFSTR